jgi:hypothetical protein
MDNYGDWFSNRQTEVVFTCIYSICQSGVLLFMGVCCTRNQQTFFPVWKTKGQKLYHFHTKKTRYKIDLFYHGAGWCMKLLKPSVFHFNRIVYRSAGISLFPEHGLSEKFRVRGKFLFRGPYFSKKCWRAG